MCMSLPRAWVSVSWRARVNAEALNMAESVGNYVKHRRAPIAVYDEERKRYVVKFVPAVSGESIAHAYQVWLAVEAKRLKLNVCSLCERGELVKHGARVVLMDEGLLKPREDVKNPKAAAKLEEEIIKKCVVEDVGGFLIPTGVPVKRTSRFYVGYMVPALEDLSAATLDPQFHVRHAPSLIGREAEFGEKGQAIYYVELGTAVYTDTFSIDLSGIGYTSMVEVKQVVDDDERAKRIQASLKALYYVLAGMFGAKRTRFSPDYELLSAVAAVSIGAPFNVSPGHSRGFIVETAKRAEKLRSLLGADVKLVALVREEGVEVPSGVKAVGSAEELVEELLGLVGVKELA